MDLGKRVKGCHCERGTSEAIPFKAATYVRDSSFRPDSRDFIQKSTRFHDSPSHVNSSGDPDLSGLPRPDKPGLAMTGSF